MVGKKFESEVVAESVDDSGLTLRQLCMACDLPAEQLMAFIEEGIIEPEHNRGQPWRFRSVCIARVRRAHRLERDLGINRQGAALAVDLLEEIERLKARLRRLEADD